MVPNTIVAGKTVVIQQGVEVEQEGEEYCRLLYKTKHKDQINCILYTDDKIITASMDKLVKVYKISGAETVSEDSEEEQQAIIKTGFVDADLNQ